MNEIRDILIGIDFGKKQSQICYYDRKAREPLSVSMKVGTSQYEFPSCICKRPDREDWCFGREAEYFAREHEGILVDNLYQLCEDNESMVVAGREMKAHELLAVFLDKALKSMGTIEPVKHTKCMVITVESLTAHMVDNLQKACEIVGFHKNNCMLQDYSESFFYHTLNQRPEYWSRNVAWFDFSTESVTFQRLTVGLGTRPVLVSIQKGESTDLSVDGDLRDMQFYQFIAKTMGNDIYSSIFITGEGFSQEWAAKSVPLLCKQKRKVFFGTNLFAQGACYTAKEKLEDHNLKGYLYDGGSLVKTNIGMNMMIMGSPALHPLILAGNNWYESSGECELILDGRENLEFQLSRMKTGAKKRISMALPGLPVRPRRTTRLKIELVYTSSEECKITVHDMGFGDMYPASGRVWSEVIRWEE